MMSGCFTWSGFCISDDNILTRTVQMNFEFVCTDIRLIVRDLVLRLFIDGKATQVTDFA